MTQLRILGVAALALAICTPDLMAQRRGGGAMRGGVRGAMVGGMVGGSSGAKTGAKVGVVAGATRGAVQRADYRVDQRAMNQEAQSRAQYKSSPEYQSVQHADFVETPPEVIVTSATLQPAAQAEESIIRQNGKPVLGISYPSDWKLKAGEHSIAAVSADGHAWSAISTLEGIQDKQAGIERIKQGLAKYLQDIQYDEPTQTEGGALIVTGTGKGKKAGINVVFATGVFDTGQQLAGAAFVVDASLDDHYKETVRYICQTIRREQDFTQ